MKRSANTQRGIVLVTSLLLLVVVTILALSMFRNFGLQEKMAGNSREKQRALHAAVAAQHYAEWWLSNTNGNATLAPVTCNSLLDANINQGVVCADKLASLVTSVTAVPWTSGGTQIGVKYVVPGMQIGTADTSEAGRKLYAGAPRFYIANIGASADPAIPGDIFQIDAVGYGGNPDAVAVVESTFAVYVTSKNLTL